MGSPRHVVLSALPLLIAFSAVSIAGTLSSVNMQASGMFSSGPTGCGQTSFSSASCSFTAYNEDPYGGEEVHGSASASSAFGALSGAALVQAGQSVFGTNFVSVQGGFSAEFNDPVLVTGGSGTGTLVVDFSWSAGAVANYGEGVWPSFTVVVGTSSESWTSSATDPVGPTCSSELPCTGSGTVDISVPFTFGGVTTVGGSASVALNTFDGEFFFGSTLNSSASLTLTGFSVYDASGNLVPGAMVTPILSPEPGTVSLLMCGALVFCALLRRRLQDRPHHAAIHA